MAKFDFAAEGRRRSLRSRHKVSVNGVKFKLEGSCQQTPEGLAMLAKRQEKEIRYAYPKALIVEGMVDTPDELVSQNDCAEMILAHAESVRQEQDEAAA